MPFENATVAKLLNISTGTDTFLIAKIITLIIKPNLCEKEKENEKNFNLKKKKKSKIFFVKNFFGNCFEFFFSFYINPKSDLKRKFIFKRLQKKL